MYRYLVSRVSTAYNRLENLLIRILDNNSPPEAWALAGIGSAHDSNTQKSSISNNTLKDLLGNGFLWAVPKHRRTVEKRLNRKFGYPDYVWKPLKVKKYLLTCNQCGHDKEIGTLCPFCYNKIRTETTLMQEKIEQELGLNPIEQEVIVLYEGEKNKEPKEIFEGKRVIEMPKPRPMWFTKNLLQKTSQENAEILVKEVKPTDLG